MTPVDIKGRERIIRDPIHGDIFVGPIQSAIINTLVFQRLRYVRQNGLLHFVFPGAVHTRFAHSIGAMWIARKVAARLFDNSSTWATRRSDTDFSYLSAVFETAALLHDVGHCAFSHSIEEVEVDGKPFFPSMEEVVKHWRGTCQLSDFLTEFRSCCPDEKGHFNHEQLGLLLMAEIFAENSVDRAVAQQGWSAHDFLKDTRSVLRDELPASDYFVQKATAALRSIFPDRTPLPAHVKQLRSEMHSLISGTLDVDRLDYLQRDSFYTGVPYGKCDTEVLINALSLRWPENEGPRLALSMRAAAALDDMLWSRYQLFNQVLNHKANVVLNELLKDAINSADKSSEINIKPPRSYHDFLEFTDDKVMSEVFRASIRVIGAADKPYAKALALRQLPRHFKTEDVTDFEPATVGTAIENFKKETGLSDKDFRTAQTKSHLLKGGGLPVLVLRDKRTNEDRLFKADDKLQVLQWTEANKLPPVIHRLHFFASDGALG